MFTSTHFMLDDDDGVNQVYMLRKDILDNRPPFELVKDITFNDQNILCMFTEGGSRSGFLNTEGVLTVKHFTPYQSTPRYYHYNMQKTLKKIISVEKFQSMSLYIFGLDFEGNVWYWDLNNFSNPEKVEIGENVTDVVKNDHTKDGVLLVTERNIIVYCPIQKSILKEYTNNELGFSNLVENEFYIDKEDLNSFTIKTLQKLFVHGKFKCYHDENNKVYCFYSKKYLDIPEPNKTLVYDDGSQITIDGYINYVYPSEDNILFSTSSNKFYVYLKTISNWNKCFEITRADGKTLKLSQLNHTKLKIKSARSMI